MQSQVNTLELNFKIASCLQMALSKVCMLFVDKLSPIIILPVSWTWLTAAVSPTAEDQWPVVDIAKGYSWWLTEVVILPLMGPHHHLLISMQHHEQLNHASPVIQHKVCLDLWTAPRTVIPRAKGLMLYWVLVREVLYCLRRRSFTTSLLIYNCWRMVQ